MKYMVQLDNGSGFAPRDRWRTVKAKRPSEAAVVYLDKYGESETGLAMLRRGESLLVLVAPKSQDNLHPNGAPVSVLGMRVTPTD